MIETETSVKREIRVAARPETVFAYFTDPQRMTQWKGIEAQLEPRPGGLYRVNINGRHVAQGRYVEIVPPRRLVLTWGWEGEGHPIPPGSTTVEITLVPDGDGTIVRLVHSGLPDENARMEHTKGWDHYLGRLTVRASGGDPGPDPMLTQTEM